MKRRVLVIGASFILLTVVWANWPHSTLPDGIVADRVVVRKAERRLELYSSGQLLRSYPVSLGNEPRGPKRTEGDGRTPEGTYAIDYRNEASSYCLSLHITYPDAADSERAQQQGADAGGMIMIHGLPNRMGSIGRLHRLLDWTRGCIAVTNPEIREIARVVPNGTPIELLP